MIIERVTLTNFGSFRGVNPIDLKPDGSRNITLIVGHGGAGKTTIGKAIRWALYNLQFHGTSGHGERDYTHEDVLKLFFREGGGAQANKPPSESNMSVKLEILPGESIKSALTSHGLKVGTYVLERSASVGKIVPSARDVILNPLSLKGPNLREVPDPQGFIEEFLLPASTSTFFMFHGDRIRDLTKQIEQPVADSIKLILDVTAMTNAANDLQKVMGQLARKAAASSQDETLRKVKQATWDKLDEDEKKQSLLRDEKNIMLSETREAVRSLETQHGDLLQAAGLFEDFDRKEKEKKELEEENEHNERKIRSLLDQFPREVLYHSLFGHAFEVKKQEERNRVHEKKMESLTRDKQQLEEMLRGEVCHVCKQPFPKSMIDSYKREISGFAEKIEEETGLLHEPDPEYEAIMQEVVILGGNNYNPTELERAGFELRGEIQDLENEMNKIDVKLRKYKNADVREAAKRIDDEMRQKEREIGSLEESLRLFKSTLDQFQRNKRELEKELFKLGGGASKEVKRNYKMAESLSSVFGEAVTELADEKRQEIAFETGQMLMKTTIKRGLFHKTAPVDVDENFQIRAMNMNGDNLEWDEESSSERSILSVSFIYGLLKASEREAPVILDTFFGNLDPGHITNITANLSSFGSQIVLMTTNTEFLDLTEYAPQSFWDHVNRYIMLRNNSDTNFVTKQKVLHSRSEAENEAKSQKF